MEFTQKMDILDEDFNKYVEHYKSLDIFMKSLSGIFNYYWDEEKHRFRYTIYEKEPRSNISTTVVCNYTLCRYSKFWQEDNIDIISKSYEYILLELKKLTSGSSSEEELIDEFTILNILPLIKKIETHLVKSRVNRVNNPSTRATIISIIRKLFLEFIDNQLCKPGLENGDKKLYNGLQYKIDTMPHPFIYFKLLEIIDLWGEEIYEDILNNKDDWIQDDFSVGCINLLGKMNIFGQEKASDTQKKKSLRIFKDYFFDLIYSKAKFQLHRQVALYESGDKTNFDVKKLIYSLLIVTKNNRYTNNLIKNKCLEIITETQLETGLLPIGHVVSNDFAIKKGEIAKKYISAKPILASIECFNEMLEHPHIYKDMKRFPILFERAKDWIVENARRDIENDSYLGWYPEYESRHSPQSWMIGQTLLFLNNYSGYLSELINDNTAKALHIEKYNDIKEGLNFDDLYDSYTFKESLKYLMSDESCRSALLFGPPGTGKSTIAKALARQLTWDYAEITPGEFLSAGDLLIISNANKLFKRLNMLKNTVIFFDEVDLLLKSRMYEKEKKDNPEEGKNQGMSSREAWIVTSLLPKFQELHNNKNIKYILATNRANNIDPAFRRTGRIDVILPVGSISWKDRYKILYKYIESSNISGRNELVDEIFKNLNSNSSAKDIMESCSEKLYWFLFRTNYESIPDINTIMSVLFIKLKSKAELEQHIVYRTFFLGEGNFNFEKYRSDFGEDIRNGEYGFIRFSPNLQPPNNPERLKKLYLDVVDSTIYSNSYMKNLIELERSRGRDGRSQS